MLTTVVALPSATGTPICATSFNASRNARALGKRSTGRFANGLAISRSTSFGMLRPAIS